MGNLRSIRRRTAARAALLTGLRNDGPGIQGDYLAAMEAAKPIFDAVAWTVFAYVRGKHAIRRGWRAVRTFGKSQ